ncbi:MAG TPA: ferritin-like domain-containing protein [Polyangiaceae bacterium]|nr:ferritin-like domain-containing protein [Polyangiaceae bacterium]
MRGDKLARFLLGLPGAVLGSSGIVGCCGSYEADVTYTIDESQYELLYGRFGNDDLPEDACSALCENREDPCGAGGAGGAGGGSIIETDTCKYDLTHSSVESCRLTVVDETDPGVHCVVLVPPSGCGRRPDGLATLEHERADAAGWLAAAAHLEAASVVAFERLANELTLAGAPRELVDAAHEAAADEIRHARTMTRFARRHGIEPPKARVAPRAPRALADIAIDNAAEGCVREAFGAVELAHAARHAPDRRLRKAFAQIAADEARHAAFSFALHDWAMSQLEREAQRAARAAMRRAAAELARSRRVPAELGLPDAARSAALLAAFLRHTGVARRHGSTDV